MIERINELAARHGGGVGTTVASFARIHVWVLVFSLLIAIALPSRDPDLALDPVNRKVKNPAVQSLGLDRNDPRGFNTSVYGDETYRLAWVAGSSIQLIEEDYDQFLPEIVINDIESIDGRPIGVDLYFLSAIRLADAYFALLDAIAAQPDMIVFTLNPAWVANPVATHEWTNLDGIAARELLGRPEQWPLAVSLLSPSDLLWGAVGSRFEQFEDRWHYGRKVGELADDWSPLDRSGIPVLDDEPSRYALVLDSRPVDFWYGERFGPLPAPGIERWSNILRGSSASGAPLNKMLLRAVGSALRESGIPSYVYLAPANDEWTVTDPLLGQALGEIEEFLGQFSGDFDAPNIVYQPMNASRFVPDLLYKDLVHLGRADALARYLARQLCSLAAARGDDPKCLDENGEVIE